MNWIFETLDFLWNLIQLYWLEILAGIMVIVFACFFVQALRASFSRLLFVSKLKSLAKKKSMKFKIRRLPLFSLFLGTFKLDITMETSDGIFNIFFCPRRIRKRNVYIFDDTKMYYSKIRALSFWGNRNWGGDPSLIMTEETNKKEIKLSPQPVGQGQNILMFQPKPIGLFVRHGNGYAQSGSGEVVGSFSVYESKDFISYIIRNY